MESCASLAPLLEPILGLGLALNLAYLNLPMFSFISVISKGVKQHLSSLSNDARKSVESTPWFKDAVIISDIHTLETFDINGQNRKWIPFKSWGNALCFNVLFYWRVGKGLSILAVGYCSLYMILGVAVQMAENGSLTSPAMCLTIDIAGAPFMPSVIALIWPVACVGAGALVRHTVMRELRYNLKDLGIKAVNDAVTEVDQIGERMGATVAPNEEAGG